ncbi:PREDICTED: uncharacterized protein LOC106741875 [Dinoponera quadriceps]|uniref:Uncharacterized protein LOC106741875 n=1 Tax=Dinoponera quadriceps TaxID=609295 RepID=A0A6P3WUI2_DINQU|nr:PREDICTED: uncharacterized protein LOC106741875 [Dinoponera quadriceps]
MHAAEAPYYKINRVVLKILGLWPYQQSRLVRMQNVLFIAILTSFIVVQLLVLVRTQYNANVLFSVLSFTFPNIFVTIKYCLYVIQANNIRYIFDRIQYDWNMLKSQEELKIIQKYADNARLYTIQFFSLAIFFTLAYVVIHCIPIMLDMIIPMNESRPRSLLFITELFVDQNTHFYTILMYYCLTNYAGCVTIAAIATILVAYVLHTCALFQITR